jgi:hypothetical protein
MPGTLGQQRVSFPISRLLCKSDPRRKSNGHEGYGVLSAEVAAKGAVGWLSRMSLVLCVWFYNYFLLLARLLPDHQKVSYSLSLLLLASMYI